MKLRNSLFRMMLCSASTLHLAVDAKIPVSGRTVLPGPGGQTTTVQGSQRPWFKATPGSDGTLIDASAGAPVVDPVIGNGALDTAPPAAFNCGRLHWLDPNKKAAEKAPPGFEPPAFAVCSRMLTTPLFEIDRMPNAREQHIIFPLLDS